MTSHRNEDARGKQIGVRIDDDLFEALERDARENGRTVTQTVRFLLGKAVLSQSAA